MQQRYDLSEFGPNSKEEYDLSEFGPLQKVPTILGEMKKKPSRDIFHSVVTPKSVKEFIDISAIPGPGMNMIAREAAPSIFSSLKDFGKTLFKGTKGEKQAVEASENAYNQAIQAEKDAALKAQEQVGKGTLGALTKEKGELQKQSLSNMPNIPSRLSSDQISGAIAHEQQAAKGLESQMGQLLNRGAQHDVRVASRMDNLINESKNEIGSGYDAVEEDLANKNITFKNTDDSRSLLKEITDLVRSGKEKSPEMMDLAKRLENIGKDTEVPARDYLSAYRTTRDAAYDARKLAYTHGISDEERMAAFKRADELEKKSEEMEKILENGIGGSTSHLLKSLNKRWSSEIAPLFKNKVYQKIRYEGRLPDNIMKSLRGSGVGMKQLREVIKKDPELLKNVVGQRFAKNPQALHDIGELEKEYVDQIPELKPLIEQHKKSLSNVERYNQQLHGSELMERTKEIDKHIKNIKEKAKRKDITLAEKLKAEKQLKALEEKKKSAMKKVWIGAGLLGAPSALYKIGKLLTPGNE